VSDDMLAVLAHGWLNHMAALSGAAMTLRDNWPELADADRDRLLSMIQRQALFLESSFRDLAEPTA
jgi:hypothetical protein